jgi:PAS domain S-box-containing protein
MEDIKAQKTSLEGQHTGARPAPRILCVDDTESNRYTRGRVLRSEGFEIIEAINGSDALRLAAEEQPSLVLLDIQLPDINGFAVCRRLKANPRTSHIPVLHVSSLGRSDHDYPEALESGAEAYLQEPVEPSVLVAVITALIRAASAEASARKAERDAVEILESIGEAMYLLDQDYRYEYVNAEAERLLGFERAALIGKTRAEVFPDSVGNKADREFQRVMTERTPSSFENFYEPWQRWFEVKASPVSGGGIAVQFRDITARKEAENERQRLIRDLTDRTGELQAILDAAPVAVWLAHDPECRQITGNAYADTAIMQGPREGNISRSAVPGEASVSYRVFRRGVELRPEELPAQVAASTGKPVSNQELALLFPDGRTVTLLMGAVPLFNGDGSVRGSVAAGADVTQLRRVEAHLQEQRAALEAAALFPEQNPQPVLRVQHDGTLLYANPNSNALLAEWNCGVGQRVPPFIGEAVQGALAEESVTEMDVELAGRVYSFVIAPIGHAAYANLYGRDITDRKRAERALRDSEKRFRMLVSASSEVLYRMSPDWNEMRQLGGGGFIPDQERPSKEWLHEYIPLEDQPKVLASIERAIRTKSVFELEHRVRRVDGGVGWTRSRAVPLLDAQGEISEWFGAASDVTERKRAEQAQRESEARAQRRLSEIEAIYRSAPVGLCVLDTDLRFVRVNTRFAETSGWAADAHIGKTPGELNPDMGPVAEKALRRVLETGEPLLDLEVRGVTAAAPGVARIWIEQCVPLKDGEGRITGVSISAEEVTERKRAEQALRESEERLRLAQRAAHVGIWDWDLRSGEVRWTPELEQIYGLEPGSVRAYEDFSRRVHPGDLAALEASWKDAVAEHRGFEVEFRVVQPGGELVWVHSRGAAAYDEDGAAIRLFGVNLDITERKQAEERLLHAQKLESLGLLAGGVAHDFNNLLVGVIGNASLAQEMLPPDHSAAELMATVVKTGEQAAHLTRQMLAYSGKGKFLLEPLNISVLAGDIIELARPSIPKKVALSLDLEEDLPFIEVDRGQVQQILMNLAINAAEAIGSHDGQVTIRTGTQVVDGDYLRRHPEAADLQPGQYVLLEVRDSGCGMDAAVKAKIFDPFYSSKFTGRGLGLAAVAGIVRGHKGAIVVTSAPGKGSTFTVLFPPAAHPVKGSQGAAPSAVAQGTGVVLVIDDEHVVRDMAKKALERHGYTVLVADGGLGAIDVLKRHPGKIDLAVLDLSMPGMSGEETLPELRKIRPELKVFVSSGYSESEAMTMFRGQRVSGFVQKPYTSAVLAEKVKCALR